MNNQFPFGTSPNLPPQFNQFQQIQQMFPQPQGSVYSINNPIEIGNVPIGSTGLSVALCLSENVMYIKSFQNGNPIIMTYRIFPFQKNDTQHEAPAAQQQSQPQQPELLDRIASLEAKLAQLTPQPTTGGKFNDLL